MERRDKEPHAAVDERGFSAARFARDAEHLAFFHRKGDIGHGMDFFSEPREIVQAEFFDFENRHECSYLRRRGLNTPSMDVLMTYRANTTIEMSTVAGMNAHHAPSESASLRIASFNIVPSETVS
jgi:hypothetical protein